MLVRWPFFGDITVYWIKLSVLQPRQLVERRVNQRIQNHLCSHQGTDDENRDDSRNIGSLAAQIVDASARPWNFYWIQRPWKLQVFVTAYNLLLCCLVVPCRFMKLRTTKYVISMTSRDRCGRKVLLSILSLLPLHSLDERRRTIQTLSKTAGTGLGFDAGIVECLLSGQAGMCRR
jgi:hypothetical protein